MSLTGSQPTASPAAIIGLIVVLAGLDLAGAYLAKEWAGARSIWLFVTGVASFGLLFAVYAIGLRYAELSTVTFGWIVGLQVSVLLLERFRYGVHLAPEKWVAIVAIVALQAYLVLAPNRDDADAKQHPPMLVGRGPLGVADHPA